MPILRSFAHSLSTFETFHSLSCSREEIANLTQRQAPRYLCPGGPSLYYGHPSLNSDPLGPSVLLRKIPGLRNRTWWIDIYFKLQLPSKRVWSLAIRYHTLQSIRLNPFLGNRDPSRLSCNRLTLRQVGNVLSPRPTLRQESQHPRQSTKHSFLGPRCRVVSDQPFSEHPIYTKESSVAVPDTETQPRAGIRKSQNIWRGWKFKRRPL